jgi:hypothetical protein
MRKSNSSENHHQLGLTEDILMNTQLYGIYNPSHYHSFMLTWNFFLPQECDACAKSIYPLVAGGCQCLRCGKYIHRQCLSSYKTKCALFTFENLQENTAPSNTSSSKQASSSGSSHRHRSSTSSKKSHAHAIKQIIKKVGIHPIQNAGSLLLDTVTYIPAVIGTTSIHLASNLIGNSSSNGKSNSSSSPNNNNESNDLNVKLEKIIEKACMIPRMIGYLPEPKSQFCIWTSSLRAIALQQSAAFLSYNSSSSSSSSTKYENIYYIYYLYLKKKRKFEQQQHQMNEEPDHPKKNSNDEAEIVERYSESRFPTFVDEQNHQNKASLYLRTRNQVNTSVDIYPDPRLTQYSFMPSLSPQEEVTMSFSSNANQSYQDEHLLFETSLDETIDVKLTAIIDNLLDFDRVSQSFPAEVCFVCFFVFLSMDFSTIIEYNNPSSQFATTIRRNSIAKGQSSTSSSSRNYYQFEDINDPHYHLMMTMKHARECIDTIVTAILSKYDQQTIMAEVLKLDKHNHSKHHIGEEPLDFTMELMALLTTIVERFLFDKFEHAMYDKVFRECSILSSLFHEHYIEHLNNTQSNSSIINNTNDNNNIGKSEDSQTINNNNNAGSLHDPMLVLPIALETNPMESLSSSMLARLNNSYYQDRSISTTIAHSFLSILNDYATKLKNLKSPMDKLKIFVIFLQFLSTAKEKITLPEKNKAVNCVDQEQETEDATKNKKKKRKKQKKNDEEFVKVPTRNISNSSLWNIYNESCYFPLGEGQNSHEKSEKKSEEETAGLVLEDTDEIIPDHENVISDLERNKIPEDGFVSNFNQRLSINDTIIISKSSDNLVIRDILKNIVDKSISVNEEREQNKDTNQEVPEVKQELEKDILQLEVIPGEIIPSTEIKEDPIQESELVERNSSDFYTPPLGTTPQKSEQLAAALIVNANDEEHNSESDNEDEEEEEEKEEEEDEPNEQKKSDQVADTDELLEKLTWIIHYQQQNQIIDWIAECIYLSSPILIKDYLAYGIESYALITLQQSIQLLLTSYYHLEPHPLRRTSSTTRNHRLKSGLHESYEEDDQNEDYYFWKQFL